MPNTIAHLAVAGLITRSVVKEADVKWIYTACVVPDLPWIVHRVVNYFPHHFNTYDLHAYAIAQSSLFVCLFFGLTVSCLFNGSKKLMVIFSIGALVHLLLDAVQIKLANGAQLLVPFNWQLLRFDFFWPESFWTYLLTLSGLAYFVFHIRHSFEPVSLIPRKRPTMLLLGVLAFSLWLLLPIIFSQWIYKNDNHFISTLSNVSERSGKYIELDRIQLAAASEERTERSVVIVFGKKIFLDRRLGLPGDTVSVQGEFISRSEIQVADYHVHGNFRDIASIIGLLLVLMTWLACLFKQLVLPH